MTIANSSRIEWVLSAFTVYSKLPKKDENYTETSEYGDDGDQDGGGQGILREYQEGVGGRGHGDGNGHGHVHPNLGGDNIDEHWGYGVVVNDELQNAMANADMQDAMGLPEAVEFVDHPIIQVIPQMLELQLEGQVPQAIGAVCSDFCSA